MSTPPPPPPPPSYVEPAPEFYARLLALARMTRSGLTAMDVLDEQATERLTELEGIIEKLLDISLQELKNEKLSEIRLKITIKKNTNLVFFKNYIWFPPDRNYICLKFSASRFA